MLLVTFPPDMPAQASAGYMTGRIVYKGKPIRSIVVIVFQGTTVKGRSLTGDDGRYYIWNLPNGSYTFVVQRGSKKLFTATLTLPANRIYNVTLPHL
jgi:hypothetical protein